jgi:hypothetical protein
MNKWAGLYFATIDWPIIQHTIDVTLIYFLGGRMEKDIALGPEGVLKMKLENGQLVLEVDYVGASGTAGIRIAQNPDYFLDALAKLIPGAWDDAVIALAKDAIKKLP